MKYPCPDKQHECLDAGACEIHGGCARTLPSAIAFSETGLILALREEAAKASGELRALLDEAAARLARSQYRPICGKCNGNGMDVPCAYPDHHYRDCEHPLKGWIQQFSKATAAFAPSSTRAKQPPYTADDGFGTIFECRLGYPSGVCCLEILRPGHAQCPCDDAAVQDLLSHAASLGTPSAIERKEP